MKSIFPAPKSIGQKKHKNFCRCSESDARLSSNNIDWIRVHIRFTEELNNTKNTLIKSVLAKNGKFRIIFFFAIQHHFIYALNPQLIEWFFSEPKIYCIFVFFFRMSMRTYASTTIVHARRTKPKEKLKKKPNWCQLSICEILELHPKLPTFVCMSIRMRLANKSPKKKKNEIGDTRVQVRV